MSEFKNELSYSPDIKYEENYYSTSNNGQIEESTTIPSTQTDDLSPTIDHIDNMLNGIPNNLANAILEIYEPIKNLYDDYLKDKVVQAVPPYKEVIITNPNKGVTSTNPSKPNDTDKDNSIENDYEMISLRLDKSLIILKEKDYRQLYHTILPSDLENKDVTWSSTNDSIATISNGLVNGIKSGRCEVAVTLTKYNIQAICKVIVISESSPIDTAPNDDNDINKDVPVKRIEVSRSFIEIYVKETFQLKVNVYPENATNKEISWSSTDTSIATVQDGLIEGIEIGQCRVIAVSKDGNKKSYCYVTVKKKELEDDKKDNNDDILDDPSDDDVFEDDEGLWDPGEIPDITINKNDVRDIIEKEFIKNISDLIDYYINSLNSEISRYYFQVLKITTNLSNDELKILFNDISMSNNSIKTQLQHLFDLSLKNLRVSNVKLNYLENSFNINQTVLHIQSFLATYEMRKKYANIKTLDSITREDSQANYILKGLKIDYDIKYDHTYFNLFRYVNSSLKITSDVINDTLQGYIAKGLLIQKGGFK